MINLLPPESKESLRYARRNNTLLTWLVGLSVAMVIIIVIFIGGDMYLGGLASNVNKDVSSAQNELNQKNYKSVQQQVAAISSNLNLMVNVLSQEVLFSAMLKQIGAIMPQGAILTGLDITQVKGAVELQAAANNYQSATQIQVNLQDPNNKLFNKADIVSIQCGSGNDAFSKTYPCKADIRAQFVAKNPFLFINYNPTSSSGSPS